MKLTVHSRPCYLLETAELVFSFVNDLPASQLTAPGEFCIPEEEALKIRTEVCRDLNPQDRQLQYFFQGFVMEHSRSRLSNLATTMLYSCLGTFSSDAEQMKQKLLDFWAKIDPPYCISAADPFALSIDTAKQQGFVPLSEEMNKVSVPEAYQLRLVGAFSQYEYHLNQLMEILRPLARRLEPLLEPWVQRAQPLVRRWEQFFQKEENVRAFFRNRVDGFRCDAIELTLRYFPAEGGYYRVFGKTQTELNEACLLTGLGMKVGVEKPAEAPFLSDQEMTALRLIANQDRLAMLHAMMGQSMGGYELAEELGLNSGTVFRDLNNLATAQLITRDARGRKSVYRTNIEMVRQLMARVVKVVNPDEPA